MPEQPGVYLMKDSREKIIYVGKAVNLKNRVRSYFSSQHVTSPKTRILVEQIRDIDYILTDSEIEALILESNLIKEHKPKYNVRLTDDKHFPFLRVSVQESFPRIEIVRAIKKDGARYFGPYTSAGAVHETLRLIKKLFPLRSCKQTVFDGKGKPCLNSHIGRCAAPCAGMISQQEYRKMIDGVILFLEGKQEDLMKLLKRQMEEAALNLEFEKAAEIRDQILAVDKVAAKQKIISDRLLDVDIINLARSFHETCIQVFFIRNGKVLGRNHYFLEGSENSEDREALSAFLKQYYSQVEYVPGEILIPRELEEKEVLESWLTGRRGSKVHLRLPKQGQKKELLDMVGKNALESLQQEALSRTLKRQASEEALGMLAQALNLPEDPHRIECYDISHIQGTETVASMVVFEEGKPAYSKYRRFRIQTVEGPDDFASMAEVIRRRFARIKEGDEKFLPCPDLVIIDGGKGQLSSAREAMEKLGFGDITAVGLAKENEWVYLEHCSDPLIIPRQSPALFLLQRIRDEAHRFAVTYHRLLRGKRNLASALDEISGIGPKRREALLKHFGMSLKKIREASLEDLHEVNGLGNDAARSVWEYFHPPEI